MKTLDIETELIQMQGQLISYAHTLTRDSHNAADLVQDTSLRILCYGENFRQGGDFGAWAHTIMHNSFLNSMRNSGRQHSIDDTGPDSIYQFAADVMSDSYCHLHNIYSAINRLPLSYRSVILVSMQGYKYEEIAEMLNLPVGTVKSRIHYSRQILKRLLKDYLE